MGKQFLYVINNFLFSLVFLLQEVYIYDTGAYSDKDIDLRPWRHSHM